MGNGILIRAWSIAVVLALPLAAAADAGHVSSIRADRGAIRSTAAQCAADAEEVIDDDHGTFAAALCKLRAAHVRARGRLLAAMNRIVDTWSDQTNHAHAHRVPATTQALQAVVAQCLRALESQQWCHNIGCATLPEKNAILCETRAAEIAEAVLNPN